MRQTWPSARGTMAAGAADLVLITVASCQFNSG
jgi:hypothetical protein